MLGAIIIAACPFHVDLHFKRKGSNHWNGIWNGTMEWNME